MAILRVRKGQSPGSVYPLLSTGQPIVLGRDSQVGVYIDDARASRRNASISLHLGRWYVEDLHSSNGTFVDGKRIQRALLEDGATIQVGHTLLSFHRDAMADFPDLDLEGTKCEQAVREGSGVFVLQGYQPALDRHVRIDWVHPARVIDRSVREKLEAALGEASNLKDLAILPLIQAEAGKNDDEIFILLKGGARRSIADGLPEILALDPEARTQIFRQVVEVILERATWELLRSPIGMVHLCLDDKEGQAPVVQVPPIELGAFIAEQTEDLVHLPVFVPYLPPERQKADWVGPPLAGAMYNLGAIGYHLLTGQPPAGAGCEVEAILENHRSLRPAPANIVVPEVPQPLSDLLDRMLEKDPARRPSGRQEVLEALAIALGGMAGSKAPSLRPAPPQAMAPEAPIYGGRPAGRPPAPPAQVLAEEETEEPAVEPQPFPRRAGARPLAQLASRPATTSSPQRRPAAAPEAAFFSQIAYLPVWAIIWVGLFVLARVLSRFVFQALEGP